MTKKKWIALICMGCVLTCAACGASSEAGTKTETVSLAAMEEKDLG